MEGNKIMAALIVMTMVLSTIVVLNTFDVKIVGNASATTPGFDEWGNATADELKYGQTYSSGEIKINTSKWATNDTYYLYYPVYTSSGTGPNADAFNWSGPYKVDVVNVKVVATQAGVAGSTTYDSLDTGGSSFSFNRSGMWIFDKDSAHNGNDSSTFGGYIWVNTSSDYTISSISDFKYGSETGVTVTVKEGDNSVGCMISVIAPDNKTIYHNWRSTGSVTLGSGNFSTAGAYTVRAYRDLDEQTGVYLYSDGETGYESYNGSYGSGLSFPTAAISNDYNYTIVGPFDPPEKNATEVTFTVETGEPNIVLTNTTVYWGFETRIDVNVTAQNGTGLDCNANSSIKLRKVTGSTYIDNTTYTGLFINNTGNGNYSVEIARGSDNWSSIGNGSWYVYFANNSGGDATEEWNASARFTVKSTTPPVRLVVTNPTNKKVNVPGFTAPNVVGYTNITFVIYGRTITGVGAYYGDDAQEDYKNITVSGDILYPPTINNGLYNLGGGYWAANVTPTKPGGTVTIAIDWPGSNNGSASETVNIINGTIVTTSFDSFTIGNHVNLTVTVKNMGGTVQEYSDVYLVWQGGAQLNSTTPGTGAAGKGQDGEYTFWIKPSEQGIAAPKNITIAANTPGFPGGAWGYTKVTMEKNHNMVVNCTPTATYAGDVTAYNIDVSLADGGNPDTSGLIVAIYDETGVLAAGDDVWSKSGAYDINDELIVLSGGTYYIHAYNATHDSQGHNATIIVTKYSVESSPSILAWTVDTSQNMTFQVTPAGNGSLRLDNMSATPNASYVGMSEVVEIINGVGTLDGVNASTLGNVTYKYTPEDGEERPAEGLLIITTATAVSNPATVYIAEPTTVEITITHPATGLPLQGVRVGLDHGMNLSASLLKKFPTDSVTDVNGKVYFSMETGGSGDITIYLNNQTDPDNPFVIKSAARKTMKIYTDPTVNEGDTFIVTAKSSGVVITDSTITIEFAGTTLTTTDGTVEFTAPSVQDSVNYIVQATADGYTSDDATIKVLNVRKLVIVITSTEVSGGSAFDVTIADDAGSPVIGATITINQKTYTTGAQGTATITAPKEQGDYIITATFPGYTDADPYTITIKAGQIPGFELLTLIAAIGVAFILLRRRRN